MWLKVGDLRALIREALKKTDVENVARSLENAAGKIGGRVQVSPDYSGKLFNIFAKYVTGDPEQVEAAMLDAAQKVGWSLLSRSEKRGLVWWFEPTAEVKGPVPRAKMPHLLWHVTPRANVEGILEKGFEPRQRTAPGTTRKYVGRIYLATDIKGAKATINRDEDWALLQIDTSRLPKSMKFYVDQEFGHRADGTPMAVYTQDPIPSVAVSVV
jgi:hypothetical protein